MKFIAKKNQRDSESSLPCFIINAKNFPSPSLREEKQIFLLPFFLRSPEHHKENEEKNLKIEKKINAMIEKNERKTQTILGCRKC